jgi:hypothetical protein
VRRHVTQSPRRDLLRVGSWMGLVVLLPCLIAGTALPTHAGESSTDAVPDYCKAITVEVAGVRYQGEVVTCIEVRTVGETIHGAVGDGLWPPTPKKFASFQRGASLSIVVEPAPVGQVHIDAYASPIEERREPSTPVVRTSIPAADRSTWPVELRPGRYVIVLSASWEGNRRASRAFGIDVHEPRKN